MAIFVLIVVFAGVKFIRNDSHQAQAAIGATLGAGVIGSDVEYSLRERGNVRRAVLKNNAAFLDLNGAQVRAILNQPELVRRDAPTTVWQYRNEACVLDLYFTTADKATKAPVAHYEIRARQKDADTQNMHKGCIRDLVRANSGPRFFNFSALYKS